jgi:hypothetical protein
MRRTRGSETSQYPEEEKSSEIPSVAASEGGRAQTDPRTKETGTGIGTGTEKTLPLPLPLPFFCLFRSRVGVVGPRYGTE